MGPGPGAPLTELAGTSWRVVHVNGRPTPATGDYSMNFESDRIGARFGCNGMGGRYRLAVDVLTVSDLAQTLMGCPEPANTFESQGAAVLGQPARIAFASDERMFLSNAAGSIVLEPIP
ncbi:MAG: META domain-containing protein [Pseudomonadota bacterium]|nr:META domain-containing protein [Pseudomonadota bacterium]